MTDGEILIGSTGNPPVAATLTQGTGISITNTAGAITIAATGGITWTPVVSGGLFAPNSAYYNVSPDEMPVNWALPYTCPAGAVIYFQGTSIGASGWQISQFTGQSIQFGAVSTTVGMAGGLSSTNPNDGVQLLCIVDNLTFQVIGCGGNLTWF